MYLPNQSAWTECDTLSIFKRGLKDFDSEFSFSKTGCLTKAEESSLPSYLNIFVKYNELCSGFELMSPCSFP